MGESEETHDVIPTAPSAASLAMAGLSASRLLSRSSYYSVQPTSRIRQYMPLPSLPVQPVLPEPNKSSDYYTQLQVCHSLLLLPVVTLLL